MCSRACQLIPQGYAATRVPPGSTRNPVQLSKGRTNLSWVLMGNGMTQDVKRGSEEEEVRVNECIVLQFCGEGDC